MALFREPRRCSICRLPGHTKRTCLARSQSPSTTTSRTSQSTVLVCRTTPHETSGHTLDLKPKQAAPLTDIPMYTVPKVVRAERKVVPFAQMIREKKLKELQESMRHTAQSEPAHKAPPAQSPSFDVDINQVIEPPKELEQDTQEKSESEPLVHTKVLESHKEHQSTKSSSPFIHFPRLTQLLPKMAAIALAVMLPVVGLLYARSVQAFGQEATSYATDGFSHLQRSTLAAIGADISGAESHLQEALAAFSQADTLVSQHHTVVQTIAKHVPILGQEITSRRAILTAGQDISVGNAYLLKGVSALTNDELFMTDKLMRLHTHIQAALPQFQRANESLSLVDSHAIPVAYQSVFDDFRVLYGAFVNDLEDTKDLLQAISAAFGGDEFKRYIVVFQNNHELRATGGFMGSFAVVDVQKGKIQHIEVPGGGFYDLQGQLAAYVAPPEPLQLVNKRWETQDANWWPDFAASSQKLQWFYQRARGTTIDGVIAVNGSMLEEVLPILGPVQVNLASSTSSTLEAQTALVQLHESISAQADSGSTAPKAIIGEALQEVLTQFNGANAEQKLRLLAAVHEGLMTKDIQIYTSDVDVQKTLRSFGWTGEIRPTAPEQDYLFVAQSNIGGAKSDALIDQSITHQAHIQPDGSVINTVIISRTHNGALQGQSHFDATNLSYTRVYVPQGATLIDAAGFTFPKEEWFHAPETWYEADEHVQQLEQLQSIDETSGTHTFTSFGKTMFANWMQVAPGETTQAYIVYKTPFTLKQEMVMHTPTFVQSLLTPFEQRPSLGYSLLVQKQSGINANFSSQVIFPEPFEPIWTAKKDMTLAKNGVQYTSVLDRDTIVAVVGATPIN